MTTLARFLSKLAHQRACLVSVHASRGSVPRDVGAWMAVFDDEVIDSIGGGQLEFQAIAEARCRLAQPVDVAIKPPTLLRYALGPSLGQCCGGDLHLAYEVVNAAGIPHLATRLASARTSVALFGAGHVGKALVQVLGSLPMDVLWVDSRDEIFPAEVPWNVRCEHSDPVHAAVARLKADTCVVIMSFSHAEDLDIVAACLTRHRQQSDLPYIGLIGSKTKWATFQSRLLQRGFTPQELTYVTSPIGLDGITGKQPEIIAISVAAQLLLKSGQ